MNSTFASKDRRWFDVRRANDFGGSSKFGENRIALERDARFFKRNFLRRAESGGSCRIGRKLSLQPSDAVDDRLDNFSAGFELVRFLNRR